MKARGDVKTFATSLRAEPGSQYRSAASPRVSRPSERPHARGEVISSSHLGAAVAESFLHARPQHQHQAQREDARGQGAQEEDGVIVVRDHQSLVERTLGELAENEADDQADERIAV